MMVTVWKLLNGGALKQHYRITNMVYVVDIIYVYVYLSYMLLVVLDRFTLFIQHDYLTIKRILKPEQLVKIINENMACQYMYNTH